MGVARGSRKHAKVWMSRLKESRRKVRKVVDRNHPLPYLYNMTNDFAHISAESDLREQIALRIEDFTGPIPESWGGGPHPELTEAEKAEANGWFDERRDSWMMSLVGTI